MQYLIYLRKSRADREAELRGEGETLARHEKALLELARRQHLPIADIYREVVSGETIASRPMMQQLLSEVEQGVWDGVLVMEVERLARGDTIDQGIVAQAFKLSDTKIITPIKTYDPNNEFDEEYFEFGLFMSRREYKTIKRRLNNGRQASVKEGKYVGNRPPYGYERIARRTTSFTLKPLEKEAQVVKDDVSLVCIWSTWHLHHR
ncbi:MAG: recombinase family protein [[Clostridium] innocuum]